jgi:polynucleotide 5'-kinase involved in rRNA processing
MNKNDLIDLVQLISFQNKEQYRALMILGPANYGKTKFAKRLAEKINAEYVDLLETFIDDESLSKSIDTFDVFCLKNIFSN